MVHSIHIIVGLRTYIHTSDVQPTPVPGITRVRVARTLSHAGPHALQLQKYTGVADPDEHLGTALLEFGEEMHSRAVQ